MSDNKYQAEIVRLGIPDDKVEPGVQKELWGICKYEVAAIIEEIKKFSKPNRVKSLVGW